MVRFPDGMRERLRASAEANGRSMNAEIVERLERADALASEVDELRLRLAAAEGRAHGVDEMERMVQRFAHHFDEIIAKRFGVDAQILKGVQDDIRKNAEKETPASAKKSLSDMTERELLAGFTPARAEEFSETPEGQEYRRRHADQWDADMAAREASGENIKPMPRPASRRRAVHGLATKAPKK